MAPSHRPARAVPPLLKRLNERTVLEAIRDGAPISRAEISRRAGISKPTVSLALQSLLDAGLVREADEHPEGPRYGAVFFEPVPDAALVLGLDLGARFLRGAVCDLQGTVRARQDVELRGAGAQKALDAFVGLRDSLIASAGLPAALIDSAVVGVPGAIAPDGRVRLAAESVKGLEGMDVAAELAPRLGVPVSVENDVNLAALGERWLGVGRGVDDFAFISIGTGVGAGLVLRGELHRGHAGAAGEIHFLAAGVEPDIDPTAAAVSALADFFAKRDGAGTALRPPYDAPAVFSAARAGDTLAKRVVEEVAGRVARYAVLLAAVSDVEVIVIGGGVGSNGDLLLEPIRTRLAAWMEYPPRVEVSSLGEAAVLSGALSVGLRAALDNVFENARPAEVVA
jgi:predicted NBD/HSP70 family sugar kinase/DNA-binding CsgD family transcriptional regulator